MVAFFAGRGNAEGALGGGRILILVLRTKHDLSIGDDRCRLRWRRGLRLLNGRRPWTLWQAIEWRIEGGLSRAGEFHGDLRDHDGGLVRRRCREDVREGQLGGDFGLRGIDFDVIGQVPALKNERGAGLGGDGRQIGGFWLRHGRVCRFTEGGKGFES
jgi:hypothetical protein